MPGIPPGIPGGMSGMQSPFQPVPRPPTPREVREAKRKNRLSEIASFAANALQNSIRSGNIKLIEEGDTCSGFGDDHVSAAFTFADMFFAAVDEMVAESERKMNAPEIVTDGDA